MVEVPLAAKMKKRIHKTLALAQDLIVMELYDTFPEAVIHGGTAIWRCYKGNRFSDDIDLYLPPSAKSKAESFIAKLSARGLVKQKFKATGNTIFAKFLFSDAVVSFEASLRAAENYAVRPFEMLDGSFMLVKVLEPEELILEKASAYKGRRKVRDLYDIFFLIHLVERSARVVESLRNLAANFRRPVDERELRAIIISGTVPTVEDMLEAIEQWAR